MDPLPTLQIPTESSGSFTQSEQTLIHTLKQEFQDHLDKVLIDLRQLSERTSHNPEQPHASSLQDHFSSLEQFLNKAIPSTLLSQRSKTELNALQSLVTSTDRLVFLTRYFNWENTEAYNKLIINKVSKTHSKIYSFNLHLQNLVKSIIQNFDPNRKVLQEFLNASPKHLEQFPFPPDFLRVKTPVHLKVIKRDPASRILLDFYYLKQAYKTLDEVLINFALEHISHKLRQLLRKLNGSSGEAANESLEGLVSERAKSARAFVVPALAELEKELERVKNLRGDMQILEYLEQSKKGIDELVTEARTQISEGVGGSPRVGERTQRSVDQVNESENSQSVNTQFIGLERVDEILAGEIKASQASKKKTLKAYWQKFNEKVRQEVVKMISLDKFLLQASFLNVYFEERFVQFTSSDNKFVSENFAKLIEDFCSNASKEIPKVKENQGVHPLFYCYVAENKQDFYLVEYNTALPILRVYLTAAPMLATLHKHLAKLDIKKIGKKSFSVTRLNFYDADVGVELRNLFLSNNIQNIDDSDEEDQYPVSKKFQYLVYISVFLLRNSNIAPSAPEVTFTVQDLMTFYNYLADFQIISLKNQEQNEPIPPRFEFLYPFVDMRQAKERQHYLLYELKDASRNMSLVSTRLWAENNQNLQYIELGNNKEIENSEVFLNEEIYKYLKFNENKTSFNFDGQAYVLDYIKQTVPVQLEPSQTLEKAFRVFSKDQTRGLLESFSSENRSNAGAGYEDTSAAAKIYLLFPGDVEALNLLMIIYDKKENRFNVFMWENRESQKMHEIGEFVEFLRSIFKGDNKKAGSEENRGSAEIRYVVCKYRDDSVVNYLKNHYFPFTYFVDRESSAKSSAEIGLGDLIKSFKFFLSANIAENNLEVFKVYSKIIEEKMFKKWEIANVGTLWKFTELNYSLQVLLERLQEEKVEHVLLSFNFLGAMGTKVYYLYLRELEAEESKDQSDTQNQPLTYQVDLYSLSTNLESDDKEVLTIVNHCCKVSSRIKLVFNAAYHVNPQNNLLLCTQIEITLTTLGYLVYFNNLSLHKAFQNVSHSLISHYEILETLMSQQADSKEQNKTSEPMLSSRDEVEFAKQGIKLRIFNSYFEDLAQETQFKKKLESEVVSFLKNPEADFSEEPDNMDLSSFLNTMNCELIQPYTFYFAINEQFTKRILTNENHILTDKSAYSLLIPEILSSKTKYENALEAKYSQISIFFVFPFSQLHIQQTLLVHYQMEPHQITFFYLHPQNDPKLNENVVAFIESLSLKRAAGNTQVLKMISSKELKIRAFPVVMDEEVQKFAEQQYPLIIKTLMHLSRRPEVLKGDKLNLSMQVIDDLLAEYVEDLFLDNMENARSKVHYRYLANLFLQRESPLTKKIALLTFLNGIASIEQLDVIQRCIKNFRDEFVKSREIAHAFFCFNVSVKQSIKHYLLHLTREDRENVRLKVFTNVLGDTDTVIDRMIQSYCVEDEEEHGEKIKEMTVFKIDIVNHIFTKYLDISSLLFAHAVCNGVSDSNEYCAQLALSPMHYLREFRNFEKKCDDLKLFTNVPR